MAAPAQPLIYRVKIPCQDEREFRERFAPKYVASGIFVPSQDPKPVGTRVRIKLELRTGQILVTGDAMVTSRTTPDRSDKPGMTMRITALHPESIKFELSPHALGGAAVTPAPAMPSLTPAPPPLGAALTPAPPPPPKPAPPAADASAPTPQPAPAPVPRTVGEALFDDFEEVPPAAPPVAAAGAASASANAGDEERAEPPAPRTVQFDGRVDEVTPEPSPAVAPPSPAPASRGRRRLLVPIALAIAVAVAGVIALALVRRGPAPPDASAARATEQLRLADLRLREGRLAGAGGDSALDHLLAAKGAAPADARVASRLALLADKFEQLGARALARKNLREAAVHYEAAVKADPGRESARTKLAEIGAATSPGSAAEK